MEYAWSLTPEAFTKPNGETIQIDKKKKDEVLIPLDVARDVIRVGRLSAHAQVCDLAQDQADNHNSLMHREINVEEMDASADRLHQPAAPDGGDASDRTH